MIQSLTAVDAKHLKFGSLEDAKCQRNVERMNTGVEHLVSVKEDTTESMEHASQSLNL